MLIPEAEIIDDQNIEIDRTILKADLVYNILYKGEPHILDMELQTSADSKIDVRVLQYHVVALWTLDARKFVREKAICLYTLLPAMQGADAPMLIEALHAMKAHYTHQQFGNHLIRFKRIVERSTTLTKQDKQRVEEEIHMHMAYDWFIDTNPDVQERVAKGEERGEERGEARGEARGKKKGLQQSALKIIHTRFPSLVEFAQTRILLIDNREELDHLIDQLLLAPDEASVRQLFR